MDSKSPVEWGIVREWIDPAMDVVASIEDAEFGPGSVQDGVVPGKFNSG